MIKEKIFDDLEMLNTVLEQMEFQFKSLPNKKEFHYCLVPKPDSCRVCQLLIGRSKKLAKQQFSHQFADVARKRFFLMDLYRLYALKAYDIVGEFLNTEDFYAKD